MMKIAAILLGATLLVGCATSGPDKGKVTSKSVAPGLKAAAYMGTAITIKKKPDTLDEFQIAHKQLVKLEMQSSVDWVTVLAILNGLPVKELQGETAQIIITASFMALQTYADGVLTPVNEHMEDIHVVVTALREGIELGLTQ